MTVHSPHSFSMSNSQALQFALTPGAAEKLETISQNRGNLAWQGLAKGIKYARNFFFATATFTAVAATKTATNQNSYAYVVLTAIGIGASFYTAQKLYQKAKTLQQLIQQGHHP